MKKVLFAMVFIAGSVVAANAQEVESDSTAASSAAVSTEAAGEDQGRVAIKTDELPEAVKQTLQDQEYKGWLINAAYHVKKKEQYEVELKNGADTQTVKFSQEGQRLDN